MPIIKTIHVCYEEGLDVLAPYIKEALEDVMACFPRYKDKYPIKILGNWYNKEGPHESVGWYIKNAKKRAITEGRMNQISTDQYMEDMASDPWVKKIPQWQILITKQDLYGHGVNWCLGRSEEDQGCIVSTARFLRENEFDLEDFKTVLMHEFGHIISLTNEQRVHTEEQAGPHCTNTGCIMQQRMDGNFKDITQIRLAAKRLYGLPPICQDCINEGNKFFARQEVIYNKIHGITSYTR